jgi:hypothetical protein
MNETSSLEEPAMSKTKPTIRPGEIAARSGQYREVGPRGGKGREVTVVKGEPLPPTTRPNRTYILVDPTRNKAGMGDS